MSVMNGKDVYLNGQNPNEKFLDVVMGRSSKRSSSSITDMKMGHNSLGGSAGLRNYCLMQVGRHYTARAGRIE